MSHTTQTHQIGDNVELMREMEPETFDTIITSPPYWGLRDYGADGQIGLEPTLDEYHARMLNVTAECMRVLKPTGVLFWNHGDSYNGSKIGSTHAKFSDHVKESQTDLVKVPEKSIPIKSMTMQNERLIIKMIDDQGWILRNRIIWNKPNGMPSSVTDRFSNKYEPVYMLVKQRSYWFDLDSVRVPHAESSIKRISQNNGNPVFNGNKQRGHPTGADTLYPKQFCHALGKNPGDVWFSDKYHFNRKYEINERYFETILTEEQAYWLGFLWGDGSISDGRRVRLSLQNSDKEHIARFKNAINSDHPINPIGNGIGIEFSCVKMVSDLENLQLKKEFPQIPDFLWRHFIRGVFDADGSIYEGKPGEYEVSIVNENKGILSVIGKIISDVVNSKPRNITKDHSVWRIRWGGTDQCRGIRDYLYSGSNVFLPRKFKKFPDGEIKWSKNTDIWTIPTQPYSEAHFATFPTALIEPMIKVACPAEICPVCGMARERIVETESFITRPTTGRDTQKQKQHPECSAGLSRTGGHVAAKHTTIGWTSCGCDAGWIAGTVLDPFCGSGTLLEVCRLLNRNAVGLELNPEYETLIKERSMSHTPPLTAY